MKRITFLCCLSSILLFLCLPTGLGAQQEIAISQVKQYGWSEGWSTVRIFYAGGKSFVFLSKETGTGRAGKNAHIHPLNADGTLAKARLRKALVGWLDVHGVLHHRAADLHDAPQGAWHGWLWLQRPHRSD